MFEEYCKHLEQVLAEQVMKEADKVQKFREADELTLEIMLNLANVDGDYLVTSSVRNIECEQLNAIDQPWRKYSYGEHGFSVQKRIWESVGGKPNANNDHIWTNFGYRVGWCDKQGWLDYKGLKLIAHHPSGHFPISSRGYVGDDLVPSSAVFVALMSRLEDCQNTSQE